MHNLRQDAIARARSPLEIRPPAAGRARWAGHAAVCLLIACAMLAVMRWWAWAWAPASIVGIIYMMYASIEMAESRSRALHDFPASGPRPNTHSALVARERIGARILATLLLGVLAMAAVVAAVALDSRTLGLGAAASFGAIVLVGMPTWTARAGWSVM